jgi:hypothetical protein
MDVLGNFLSATMHVRSGPQWSTTIVPRHDIDRGFEGGAGVTEVA